MGHQRKLDGDVTFIFLSLLYVISAISIHDREKGPGSLETLDFWDTIYFGDSRNREEMGMMLHTTMVFPPRRARSLGIRNWTQIPTKDTLVTR